MTDHMHEDISPIVIYSFLNPLTQGKVIELIRNQFKITGHSRQLEFRFWSMFKEPPPKDGDFYMYDVMVLNDLAKNGYIRQVPEIISTDELVEWAVDTTKFKGKSYGLPFILCSDAIICKKEDRKDTYTAEDLKGKTAILTSSMLVYYYYKLCGNCPDKSVIEGDPFGVRKTPFKILKEIITIVGGKDVLCNSGKEHAREVLMKFMQGQYKYVLAFGEHIGLFSGKDYCVQQFLLSDGENEANKLQYADNASIGLRTEGEKLLDCIDLMEIFTQQDFQYTMCTEFAGGVFIAPSNKKAFAKLSQDNERYKQLEEIFLNPENTVTRLSENHYEVMPKLEEHLREMLMED